MAHSEYSMLPCSAVPPSGCTVQQHWVLFKHKTQKQIFQTI